ncbi:MAG TPA: carbohydrate ABC transporter permease [Conexibacter sp.]|jgi:raffinose/stachyose/melibiose transport system permease protein|nr:carbohydrate ABC transporter permease [Conexibacter sp.]
MTSSRPDRAVTHALLLLFSFIAVLPIVAIVLTALNGSHTAVGGIELPQPLSLHALSRAWDTANFSSTLVSSAIIAIGTTILTVTISVLAGYAFAILRFPGRNLLFALVLVGLVVPREAMIIPLYYDVNSYASFLSGTYAIVVLAETGILVAFGVFWMRAFFAAVPRSLIDAATLDGANPFTVLRRVLLKPAWPAVLTLIVLIFLWSWNEFLLPLVLLAGSPEHQTAPVSLALFTGRTTRDVPGLAAGSLIVAAPVLLLYVVFQRQFIRGVMSGAVKG